MFAAFFVAVISVEDFFQDKLKDLASLSKYYDTCKLQALVTVMVSGASLVGNFIELFRKDVARVSNYFVISAFYTFHFI